MEPRITLVTIGVSDLPRSVHFYRDGLGWPTAYEDGDPVAFFHTQGTRLSLYPLRDLAADISADLSPQRSHFAGITLAHNVRAREQVAEVLALAQQAGGQIVKAAQDTDWGGHSGYFTDLDGYHWEVAWNPGLPLDDQGFMNLSPIPVTHT
jgi:catechol 2,3-dioxygenase-like lactoylglutathione lyase family enzyme